MKVHRFIYVFSLILVAVLPVAACGDMTLEEVDPLAAPLEPTYTEDIAPLMEHYCTACHAPDAQTGETEGLGYETCDKVKRHWDGIIETTVVGKNMPPAGAQKMYSWELLTLERWERQGFTCE